MIDMYGLTYRSPQYLDKFLASMSYRDLNITIVDSKSCKSEETLEVAKHYLKMGVIKRFIQCSGNCRGWGYRWAFNNFPPSGDWCIMTDTDVIPQKANWLEDLQKAMDLGVNLTGFSLSLDNYCPPNYGHVNHGLSFGYWLMGVKNEFYKRHHTLVLDSQLIQAAKKEGSAAQLNQELYHLAWDLWKDDPEYFADKVKGIDWTVKEDYTYEVHTSI